jgi:hypothetical protein
MRQAIRKSVKAASAIFMAITALVCITSAANAATGAGGIPILDALYGNQAHRCNVIGSDQYGNKGVVCADIFTTDDSTWAYGTAAIELICENSAGAVVQCAGAETTGEFADIDGTTSNYYSYTCGHPWGGPACAGGRNVVDGPSWQLDRIGWSCGTYVGETSHVWSIALGYLTQIRLPESGKVVELETGNANDGYNESSGHNYVCYN